MSWYEVTISAHQSDFYQHGRLQDTFTEIFIQLGRPKDMALFDGGWSRSDTFNIYFTPACASHPVMKCLMDNWGAVLCEEPTRETEVELGLLVGDSVKWRDHIWCPDLPQVD